MDASSWIGVVLVAGFVVFLVGAVRWRLAYEQPMEISLPLIHAERRRRTWIHLWMTAAMFLTPAGVAALAFSIDTEAARAGAAGAAVVYTLGAACFLGSLTFALTVVPWAAEHTVENGTPPEGFAPLDSWAGSLYVVFMAAAYAAFAILGAAILVSGALPDWLGWLGVGLGLVMLAGFILTRFAGLFNPPILAHTYTAVVGVVLLLT